MTLQCVAAMQDRYRFQLRVDGSIESLAQLMVAIATTLSGWWVEQDDALRGMHFVLAGSPLDVIGRADLAPSAVELDLAGGGDAAPMIAELAQRLQRHLSRRVTS